MEFLSFARQSMSNVYSRLCISNAMLYLNSRWTTDVITLFDRRFSTAIKTEIDTENVVTSVLVKSINAAGTFMKYK